jgi:DHA1 family bicyclomycin/chloramphenicol resistance-like MFS transporter
MASEISFDLAKRQLPPGFSIGGVTFVLATLSWIGPFSIDTYLPSIPSISQNLGVSVPQVQQTVTAFLFSFAVMSLWHGAISDAYGRRRLTLISLVVFLVASVGCALAGNLENLMVFRTLQGMSAGAGAIVGRAIVRDVFEGPAAQRLMSHVATLFAIAPLLAPVVGGWLQVWFGWRAVFFFLVILAGFLLLCSWRALPETLPPEKRQRLAPIFLIRSYWRVLTAPTFLLACGSMALCSAGFFIYVLGAPVFLMDHLRLRETQFLWLFGPSSLAMVIGAWVSGHVAGKITGKQTIMRGYGVMVIGAAGNIIFHAVATPAVPWSIMPLVLYIIGMSMAMPSLTLLALDLFPIQRGLAASCQGFFTLGANSVVAAFLPLVWKTPLTLAWTQAASMIVGLATTLLYYCMVPRPEAATLEEATKE